MGSSWSSPFPTTSSSSLSLPKKKRREKDPSPEIEAARVKRKKRRKKRRRKNLTKYEINNCLCRSLKYLDAYEGADLGLVCTTTSTFVSASQAFWFSKTLSISLGDWRWFFGRKGSGKPLTKRQRKCYGGETSWRKMYAIVREAQHAYVLGTPEIGKSFPRKLQWTEGETWGKVENPPRLRSCFYDYLFMFGSFVDGCGDGQMDIYPIGFSAYIRNRGKKKKGDLKMSFFETLRALSCQVSPSHPGLDFVGKGDYDDWRDAFTSTRGPHWKIASDIVKDPLLCQIGEQSFERSTRENRQCRMLISRALGECPTLRAHARISDPLETLHLVFRVVECLIRRHRSERTYRVLECDGEPIDGLRVQGEDVRGTLYASDVVKALEEESRNAISCNFQNIRLSWHYRCGRLDHVRDNFFVRMKKIASRHIARTHTELGGRDDDRVLRLALSDADRMPIGPAQNDHNGAIHEAQIAGAWVWVVLGKDTRC